MMTPLQAECRKMVESLDGELRVKTIGSGVLIQLDFDVNGVPFHGVYPTWIQAATVLQTVIKLKRNAVMIADYLV